MRYKSLAEVGRKKKRSTSSKTGTVAAAATAVPVHMFDDSSRAAAAFCILSSVSMGWACSMANIAHVQPNRVPNILMHKSYMKIN
jgi:hypothetical protein